MMVQPSLYNRQSRSLTRWFAALLLLMLALSAAGCAKRSA